MFEEAGSATVRSMLDLSECLCYTVILAVEREWGSPTHGWGEGDSPAPGTAPFRG